jgi:hypothetical protein
MGQSELAIDAELIALTEEICQSQWGEAAPAGPLGDSVQGKPWFAGSTNINGVRRPH